MNAALTIAFIDKHPLSAARALSAMDPDDAAAFLETVPTRYAARVMARAGAWPCASIIARMQPADAAAALRELSYQDAAAILRLVQAERRAPILEEAPVKLRRDLELSLSFPEDTVGAHMTTDIAAMERGNTIADMRAQVRRAPGAEADLVYVVNAERRLLGAISAADLLRRSSESSLGDIMDTDIEPISARARLSSVADLEAWNQYAALPVVSRQKHLIGALSRKAAKSIDAARLAAADTLGPSIAAAMAEAFVVSVIGLAQLTTQGAPLAEGDAPREPAP
jgi:magnesium transporter